MNKRQFNKFWKLKFGDLIPIWQKVFQKYEHHWFRIHSLLESKRFANTEEEWGILLNRQNTIIDDVFSKKVKIVIVINFIEIYSEIFKTFNLENIGVFVNDETVYQSFCIELNWEYGCLNSLLKEMLIIK